MKYHFIGQNQNEYCLDELCNALEVTRSGYYLWKDKAPSAKQVKDEQLKGEIGKIHKRARGRYGHRAIHSHLKDGGYECGRDRTLRLMKQLTIAGSQASRYKPMGTQSNHSYGYSPNLLKKHGAPSGCDEVWVADTTYLRVEGRWMYLATVMDLFSRRIVGWSVSEKNDARLVCQALKNAKQTRGALRWGIIHHSDRGSTYAGDDYRRLLEDLAMLSSMSAKGNCYDNAAMESFFGRFKVSTIGNHILRNDQELRTIVFEYIEMFYNAYRKHSSLQYQNPIQFEENNLPPMGGSGQDGPFTKTSILATSTHINN